MLHTIVIHVFALITESRSDFASITASSLHFSENKSVQEFGLFFTVTDRWAKSMMIIYIDIKRVDFTIGQHLKTQLINSSAFSSKASVKHIGRNVLIC